MAADLDETIREAGLKVTAPRRKVLDLFESEEQRHLSADEIFQLFTQQGDAIGLATVYRVLAQFESAGILVRHQLDSGKTVFELSRYGMHNHLICMDCGLMTCFTDEVLDAQLRKIAAAEKREVTGYALNTYTKCLKKNCDSKQSGQHGTRAAALKAKIAVSTPESVSSGYA